MMKGYRVYNLALSLFAIMGLCFALAGCADDDAANAEPECSNDFDCAFGQSCDTDRGVCQAIDGQNGQGPGGRPVLPECTSNAGCPHGQSCNTEIGKCEAEGATGDTDNNDPNVCDPACGGAATCVNGVCVLEDPEDSEDPEDPEDPLACDPACQSGETCESGTCVPDVDPNACTPACGSDETCESGTCVPDDPDACHPVCDISEHCDEGVCRSNASNPDDCNGACGSGTVCQNGQCVADTPDPDVCNPPCAGGLVCSGSSNLCVPPTGGGGTCTLWTPYSGCAEDDVCNPISNTQGVCTSDIDPSPRSLGDSCSPTYDTCGQLSNGFGVACHETQGGSFACFMHCRDGYRDCDVLDDAWAGEYYYCVNVGNVFPGASNVGVCSQ